MKTSKGIPGDISGVIIVEITDYILELTKLEELMLEFLKN